MTTSKPRAQRFKLVPFDEIELSTECGYLVKGLIPREGLIVLWGPPKCGKSFFAFDLMMHVALGWDYRDRRVTPGPVVYVACEGERGIGARVAAFRKEKMSAASAPPFYLVTTRLDLVGESGALIESIQARIGETRPVAIVLDTLNRSLVGSESSDEDMGRYVQACDLIRATFGCAVIVVHHCGIDDKRPRGHTSLAGAADAQIAVRRDAAGTITATVEWMKDGPEGEVESSTLRVVEVATDVDGEPIVSCVVEPSDRTAAPTEPRLTKNQQTMLTILHEAGAAGLTIEDWNAKARAGGLGVSRKADLLDCRSALKRKGLVHEFDGQWFAQR